MGTLGIWLHGLALAAGVTGLLYTTTITLVALISVTSKNARLRQDARETLRILIHRPHQSRPESHQ